MDWRENMQFLVPLSSTFADLRRDTKDIMAEGNKVAVRLQVISTHKGEFQRVAPTNKKVSLAEKDILYIIVGKISKDWSIVDMLGLMRQVKAISINSSDGNS